MGSNQFFHPVLQEMLSLHKNFPLRISFTSTFHGNNVLKVLPQLGLPLQPTGENHLDEIDRERAHRITSALLTSGLVNGGNCMTREKASQLASQFLEIAAPDDAKFYTNGAWDQPGGPGGFTSYATDPQACDDGGIIILHSAGAACFWVEGYD